MDWDKLSYSNDWFLEPRLCQSYRPVFGSQSGYDFNSLDDQETATRFLLCINATEKVTAERTHTKA